MKTEQKAPESELRGPSYGVCATPVAPKRRTSKPLEFSDGLEDEPDPFFAALAAGLDVGALIEALMHRPAWQLRAACRGMGPSAFFPTRNTSTAPAKAICDRCEVRAECLTYGFNQDSWNVKGIPLGVWGGLSGQERNRIAQLSPHP